VPAKNQKTPCRREYGPNYPALVDVLLNLRQPLDLAGETILTSDEAAQIRACGVEASPGRWRCPRLPKSVVGTLWKLSHLAEDDGPATYPGSRRTKRGAVRHVSIDPLDKADRQFLGRLRLRPLVRRLLQQTLGRDYPARTFNHKRKQLARQGYLVLHKGLYSLTHKGAAAIAREDVSISRTAISARGYVEFFGSCGVYSKYRIRVRGGVDSPILVGAEPLTPASPRLESNTFLVWNHVLVEAAFLEAVQRLEALPGNVGLCRRVRGR
jgi:hypothetical protein